MRIDLHIYFISLGNSHLAGRMGITCMCLKIPFRHTNSSPCLEAAMGDVPIFSGA